MLIVLLSVYSDIMPRKARLKNMKYLRLSQRLRNVSLNVSIPISYYYNQPLHTLKELEERLYNLGLPKEWIEVPTDDNETAPKEKIFTTFIDPSLLMLKVNESLHLSLKYDGYEANFPVILTGHANTNISSVNDLHSYMSLVKKSNICNGNQLEEFSDTNTEAKITLRMGKSHFIKSIKIIIFTGKEIIYNPNCQILCCKPQSYCLPCKKQRSTLLVQKCRYKTERTNQTTHVPHRYLSKEQMKERMVTLQKELIKVKKQRDRLITKVNKIIEAESISLSQHDHEDLKEIIVNEEHKIKHKSTLQKIFWDQQVEAAKKFDSRGMKWHPLMVRLCILLRHQSQSAYEILRQCISLPSQRTLRDYTHFIKAKPGFSGEVDSLICSTAQINECEERERNVIILLDEMHIREDLVFDKNTGKKCLFIIHHKFTLYR